MTLAPAILAAHAAQAAFNGGTVTYAVPGSGSGTGSVDVTAVFAVARLDEDREGGARVVSDAKDFLVLAADLAIGGTVVEPMPRDRVSVTAGGTTKVYELIDPPFRPCDAAGVRLRLFAQLRSQA